MLPYGTLWKLDQMLHPAGPPPRRTVAMRRRQAFFYFLWAALLVSVFLLPYHYAALRRQRLDGERRLRGAVAPAVDMEAVARRQEGAAGRLAAVMALHREGKTVQEGAVGATAAADFATLFYYHPATETRLDGVFQHPTPRSLAGAGAGTLWSSITDARPRNDTVGGAPMTRRRTIAEVAAEALSSTAAVEGGSCLAALRRDELAARLGSAAADATAHFTRTLLAALEPFATMRPLTLDAADGTVAKTDAVETFFAHFFLWLTSDGRGGGEEAVAQTVAGCTAPLSRALHVAFRWQVQDGEAGQRATVLAATESVEEAQQQGQYVCLCGGPIPAGSTRALLVDAARPSHGLFLLDPRNAPPASPSTCAEACRTARAA